MQSSSTDLIVSSQFDGGNGTLVRATTNRVELEIRNDPFTAAENAQFKQYFHFRVSGCKSRMCEYVILNAGDCSYASAWEGYNVCASYDREFWFRVPTTYDAAVGQLNWKHNSTHDQVFFAYFAPYSQERHLSLLAKCASSPRATVKCLGYTLDGRTMDMVTIGSGPLKVWAIARQHPGECMAEWWAEGYISRLLDSSDSLVNSMLEKATFYVVPNMNPDGSFRGHLRTNAQGANLNREWRSKGEYVAPSLERSPEVYHVLNEITAEGCDMFMDIHGDEALPYAFISGSEGVPRWQDGPRLGNLQDMFVTSLMQVNPDMQNTHKYPINPPNGANLSVGSKHIAQTFDCLSFTIEMPFKDTIDHPNEEQGWSPERSIRFGASFVNAVSTVVPHLR